MIVCILVKSSFDIMCVDCAHSVCDSLVGITCETCKQFFSICGPKNCNCVGLMKTTCDRCGKECTICKQLGGANHFPKNCRFCPTCTGNNDGRTELHETVLYYEDESDAIYVENIVNSKDIKDIINLVDMQGKTALEYAVEMGQKEIVAILLKAGAELGEYILERANDGETLKTLLQVGRPPFTMIKECGMKAASKNNLETLVILLNTDTNISDDIITSAKTSYLKVAISNQHYKMSEYLLLCGASWKDLNLPAKLIEVVLLIQSKTQKEVDELKKEFLAANCVGL